MIEQKIYDLLLSQLEQKDEQIKSLTNQTEELITQIKLLTEKVDYLTVKLYGAKSERSRVRLPKNTLEETAKSVVAVLESESASILKEINVETSNVNISIEEPQALKPKRENVQRRAYESLEEEIIELELKDCPKDAILLRTEDTFRLVYIPGKVKKIIYRRAIYLKDDKFYMPELPDTPLDKCYADSSLLAAIIVNKYRYHLPLERQLDIFKSLGIDIAKSTFNNWVVRSIDLLEPLTEKLREVILRCDYLNIDETTVPLLLKGVDKCKKAYIWGMISAKSKLSYFYYDNGSRGANVVEYLLNNYTGAIQSDDCASYKVLESRAYRDKILSLSCLAHIRRKICESIKNDNKAQELFDLINCIYHFEHLWQRENKERLKRNEPELSSEEILEIRKRSEFPIMLKIYRKLQIYRADKKVLPKSSFGKAVNYAYNEALGILNCLRSGKYSLDNNAIERQFKNIILGRRNYLFVEGHASAKRTASVYSLIACCKLNDIDPFQYLSDVLSRINNHNHLELEELLPHRWKGE